MSGYGCIVRCIAGDFKGIRSAMPFESQESRYMWLASDAAKNYEIVEGADKLDLAARQSYMVKNYVAMKKERDAVKIKLLEEGNYSSAGKI